MGPLALGKETTNQVEFIFNAFNSSYIASYHLRN